MSVEKRNAEFNKLSAAQKRVAIAEDALRVLRSRKFKATHGVYVNACLKNSVDQETKHLNLKDVVEKPSMIEGTCEVCAKGALLVGKLRLNGPMLNDLYDGQENIQVDKYDVMQELKKYFSETQLDMIEIAFEGKGVCNSLQDNYGLFDQKYTKVHDWYYKHRRRGPNGMLTAILKNIIQNNGTFKP